MINVASMAAELPTSYFSVYNACKIYVDRLTRASALEYPEVDFMSLKPSEVKTRMTSFKEDIFTISADKCVKALLNDIGYQTISHGHTLHAIQSALYQTIPTNIFIFVWEKVVYPEFIKVKK
jgi:short-subunit dehydrogenase